MKDQGRTVQHFGKWYIWSATTNGNLTLILVDRMLEQLHDVREQIKLARKATFAGTDSPVELAVRVDGGRPA